MSVIIQIYMMNTEHFEIKTFLLKAYLLEVDVVHTKILLALIGIKVRKSKVIKLSELEKWSPEMIDGWDAFHWKKLCSEIYRIKTLNAMKKEPV